MIRKLNFSIYLVLLACIAGASVVYAAPTEYIDPNTGGMLFQILAVVFTLLSGLIFFFSSRIKLAFARFMRFVREKRGGETSANPIHEQGGE